jgi:hypothetical protein
MAVATDSIAQRTDRYAEQVRGAGSISMQAPQRLQNELALDHCQRVSDELVDAFAVNCRELECPHGVDALMLSRFVSLVAWHRDLRIVSERAPARGQGELAWLKMCYYAMVFSMELFEVMELYGTRWNFEDVN